ncbi:hypothetical protein RB601_002174 [Gaeumannomyces tritici]
MEARATFPWAALPALTKTQRQQIPAGRAFWSFRHSLGYKMESVSVYSPYMAPSSLMNNVHGEGPSTDMGARGARADSPKPVTAAVSSPAPEPIAAEHEREKAAPGVEILTPETAKPLREMGAIASERAAPSREPPRVYAPVAVRVRREHTSRSSRCCHCSPKKKLGAPQMTESSQTADSTLVVPEYLDTVVLLVENCRQSVAVRVSTARYFLRGMWASRST